MENPELQLAWQFIENTGTHLFLTGKAGTGKTTFLRQLKEQTPKRMIVVAPTGIAAINAGGITIHSFFQLPFAPFVPNSTFTASNKSFHKFSKEKINIIRTMDLLVIDEVSMVRADLLDAIDAVLRRYRDRQKPFGGVQLLMIGDLQQLAPIVKDSEHQLLSHYYDTTFFFGSSALKQTEYVTIELKRVYRQTDLNFINLLNKIREKEADDAVLDELNKRYLPHFQPKEEEGYIRLTTHNYQAQQYNDRQLLALPERAFHFKASITGIFPDSAYPADELLTVKKGAQIMFLKNDQSSEKRFYNGKIGRVISVAKGSITVLGNGDTHAFALQPEEWANSKYMLNPTTKEITEKIEGTFRQYPIRLAWAITIHKSQGLTFERAIIDASTSFAHGQVYVALSRCKTLDGLVLGSPLTRESIIENDTIDDFTRNTQTLSPSKEKLSQLQRSYFYDLLCEQFGFTAIDQYFSQMLRLIDEHLYRPYPQLLKQYKEAHQLYRAKVTKVAETFHSQYTTMVADADNYADNQPLQQRIVSGACYFGAQLKQILLPLLADTKIQTDNKELKKKLIETLQALNEAVRVKSGTLYCTEKEGFTASTYLKCKAMLMLADTKEEPKAERKPRSASSSSLSSKSASTDTIEVSTVAAVVKETTKEISYNYFKQGMTLEQIAQARGFVTGTIAEHLSDYVRTGKIKIEQLVPDDKVAKITRYLKKYGAKKGITVVKAALGNSVGYADIKLVVASLSPSTKD